MASSSRLGEVKISLNSDSALGQPNFSIPNLDIVMKFMDKKYIRSCNTFEPQFSMAKLLDDLCRSYLKLGYRKGSNSKHANSQQYVNQGERNHFRFIRDITKGSEKVKISLIDETGSEDLPKFNYIPCNCFSSPLPCPCAQETGGEFAYTPQGLLKEEFLIACVSMKNEPQDHHYVYCQECPLEKSKNEYMPERCKGHMVRKFIKECWRKCGNRIVQRALRMLVVDEYIVIFPPSSGVLNWIMQDIGNERHTYPVTLDANWGSKQGLKDEEALCLDATNNGNVERLINHSHTAVNSFPGLVHTTRHTMGAGYARSRYLNARRGVPKLAFFTNRRVSANEELTWDYGIVFADHDHPIKAFQCCCGSVNSAFSLAGFSILIKLYLYIVCYFLINNVQEAFGL
ncbi:Histone-lysine N-methyltransferase SUVR4 [Glycine soja]